MKKIKILLIAIFVVLLVIGCDRFSNENYDEEQNLIDDEENNDIYEDEEDGYYDDDELVQGIGKFDNEVFSLEFSKKLFSNSFDGGYFITNGEDWNYDFKIDIYYDYEFDEDEKPYNNIDEIYRETMSMKFEDAKNIKISKSKINNRECVVVTLVFTAEGDVNFKCYTFLNPKNGEIIEFMIYDWTKNGKHIKQLDKIVKDVKFKFD